MQYALLKNTCTAQKALVFLMNTVPQNISQSIRYNDVSVGHVGLKKWNGECCSWICHLILVGLGRWSLQWWTHGSTGMCWVMIQTPHWYISRLRTPSLV